MSAKKPAKPKNTIDMEKLAEEVRTKIRKKVDKEKPANKGLSTLEKELLEYAGKGQPVLLYGKDTSC